jgi:hypothetical protein
MTLPTDDKARKALPIFTFLTTYFPDAIVELVQICVQGNVQHNPERAPEDIVWARGKSMNQLDTAFRHMWDHKLGTPVDSDGRYHLGKAAWRNLAALQLQIEADHARKHDPPPVEVLRAAPIVARQIRTVDTHSVKCLRCGVSGGWRHSPDCPEAHG